MVVATEKSRLLWVCADAMPPNVARAVEGAWDVQESPWGAPISHLLRQARVAVICPPAHGPLDVQVLASLLDQVDRTGAVAVVLVPPDLPDNNLLARRRGQFVLTPADTPPLELAGRIAAAEALQPAIQHLRTDVDAVRSFSPGSDMEEFDEQMRLAARLQRDFLPQTLPEVGPIRFASLYRPASWVSGDMFDVFRLDESHLGFYVADVVGHGLPAALLTIFIKKSLQTKRILGNSYEIVPPAITLALLNDDLCRQGLTSCQFCTAWYGIIDVRTLRMQWGRGGHPPALLIGPDQPAQRLDGVGPLLGVFPGETFQGSETTLTPGQRLVIFSDGAEEAMGGASGQDGSALSAACAELTHLPPREMALHLTARIDERRAGEGRSDDATVLIVDAGR